MREVAVTVGATGLGRCDYRGLRDWPLRTMAAMGLVTRTVALTGALSVDIAGLRRPGTVCTRVALGPAERAPAELAWSRECEVTPLPAIPIRNG